MRWPVIALAALTLVQYPQISFAGPEQALEPLEKYTSPKAKNLAARYADQLFKFSEQVYNCHPWLDLRRMGFFKVPRAEDDNRYLSVWISVDQKEEGSFAAMSRDGRASAMFSRYGVDFLRRLSAMSAVVADANVYGFSVAISWGKPGAASSQGNLRVEETLAMFVDKATVEQYLNKQLPFNEFTERATLNLFDGKDRVGRVPLEVWEDSFNTTYKMDNYEPPKGSKC